MAESDLRRDENTRLWTMSLQDLTQAISSSDPRSRNWELRVAVLQARAAAAAVQSAEQSTLLTTETRGLRRATWVMAVATFVAAVTAVVVAVAS